MSCDRLRVLVLDLVLVLGLAAAAGAQAVRLNREFAGGNLFRGTATLTRDGRWVVFAGRYFDQGPGVNSLYCAASDGSSEPFLLYDHGDIPGVEREFDPGTVTFVHVTPNSRWAVFTVDERYAIYSARLDGERRVRPTPRTPDPFVNLAQADPGRDFQLAPDGSRAVFFGFPGLYSVRVDGHGQAVQLVAEDPEGARVRSFAIDARSTRVVFSLGEDEAPLGLFSAPIVGSERPVRLSPLRVRSTAGTSPGPAPQAGVLDFQLAPDGTRVLFRMRAGEAHLFVVPTDGSAPARHLASGVDLAAFTPDSTRAVYRAGSGASTELLVEALDGLADPLVLHAPAEEVEALALLADAALFVESPSSSASRAAATSSSSTCSIAGWTPAKHLP